ncbi:predicted protein [Uncinocarpus reesii 1704]|uniref:SUN domain-containing protein n=1 Tax=Uncinocarpus reesii (strain UAMH 1704) TaxID=336963 RepID=C4JQB8_UNCRE|nr:uncharacterized protein UREG_04672 [Uncinocarpus reesii 1704]EEP79826.1 predicted protein [Uncinocarpus reesii 1704]
MVETRRGRSGRSVSQEPSGQNQYTRQGTAPLGSQNDATAIPASSFDNPSLPAIQTQQSFAYGATGSPAFPRQLRASPPMAAQFGAKIERPSLNTEANDFERIQEQARANPGTGRATRLRTNRQSASPTRRTPGRRTRTREPTPDDQLLGSLREASEEAEGSKEVVLPSIEDSSVSWNTERHVIADPRHGSVANSADNASGAGSFQVQPQWRQVHPMAGPPLRPSARSQPAANFQVPQEARVGPSVVASSQSAPQLGAIPVLAPSQGEDYGDATPISKKAPSSAFHSAPPTNRSQQGVRFALMTVFFMLFAFGGMLIKVEDVRGVLPKDIGKGLNLPPSFCGGQPATSQYADALNKLSTGVDQRLADMARDVAALKDEWNKRLPHLRQAIWPEREDPLLPRRINWFSTGMGAFVDPYLTTKFRPGLLKGGTERAVGVKRTNPPAAALTRWDEHGDCWCVNDHTSEIQLAVLLGRPLVPEEVVIEHIHKEATLDPESAPREMELWVEYSSRSASAAPSTVPPGARATVAPGSSEWLTQRPELLESSAEAREAYSGPLSPSQREDIISTLRMAYPDEPETAYSQDTKLGSTYYRVGKFQYDINGKHNIQRFLLDAVIDLPNIRTKKAVLRVKSNWGSVNTCIYRARLHGHM